MNFQFHFKSFSSTKLIRLKPPAYLQYYVFQQKQNHSFNIQKPNIRTCNMAEIHRKTKKIISITLKQYFLLALSYFCLNIRFHIDHCHTTGCNKIFISLGKRFVDIKLNCSKNFYCLCSDLLGLFQ